MQNNMLTQIRERNHATLRTHRHALNNTNSLQWHR